VQFPERAVVGQKLSIDELDYARAGEVVAQSGRERLIRKPEVPGLLEGIKAELVTRLRQRRRPDVRIGHGGVGRKRSYQRAVAHRQRVAINAVYIGKAIRFGRHIADEATVSVQSRRGGDVDDLPGSVRAEI